MQQMTAALGGPAVHLHNIDLNISIAKVIKIRPSILIKANRFHTWGCNQLLLMETGTAEVVVLATFLTVFAQFLGHHFAVVNSWVAVGATDYVLLDGRGGQSGLRRGRLLNIHSRWIG